MALKWELRSALMPERFVHYDDEVGWSSDGATQEYFDVRGGPYGDAWVTPTGPVHPSDGEGDEVSLYINAGEALPGDVSVSGSPPSLDSLLSDAVLPEGAVG